MKQVLESVAVMVAFIGIIIYVAIRLGLQTARQKADSVEADEVDHVPGSMRSKEGWSKNEEGS